MARDTDAAIQAALNELSGRIDAVLPTNIGWPAASDVDFSPLAPFFERHLLNNLGDPFTEGAYPQNTKKLEAAAVTFVADLMRAPANDRWGYVTTGAGEGNLYALQLARGVYPRGIVYYPEAAHFSVDKSVDLLGMPSIRVRADDTGQMDLDDFEAQVDRNRDRPVIVVANIGTTMTEAVDDVRTIHQILDSLAIRRRFIHADGALSGIPLALMAPEDRPGFDFADGADSVIVSGHKFLGTPMPCGVVVVKASHRAQLTRTGAFTGSPDTTITCSRSGHAALMIWYALCTYGVDGLRTRAERSRELAAYTHKRLVDLGWNAWRNPYGFTVILDTPPPVVTEKWKLASTHGRSHIICMPGVTREQIDNFVADLRVVADPVPVGASRQSTHNGVAPVLRTATPATA